MEFVTIHDLSRELNIPDRVVRYRFHQLCTANRLVEGADFRRDDYADEQHFTWKINPLSYMRETGKTVAPPPGALHLDAVLTPPDQPPGNQTVNNLPPPVNRPDTKMQESVDQPPQSGNQVGSPNKAEPNGPSLEREVIEFLKEQIHTKDDQIKTKDEQIKDIAEQLKGINDLNIKLVGQNVHQSERIQELLQLTTRGQSPTNVATKSGNQEDELVNEPVNHTAEFVTHSDSSAERKGFQTGSHITSAGEGQGSHMAA